MNQNLRSTSAEREAVAWAPLWRQSIWDAAVWAWHSSRLFSIVLVAVALILGAQLRFHALARFGMSADEGASWAGASAPNIHQVAVIEQQLDPGKLELYDVLLHEWIGVFGDSVFAMRSMSAALGTIAIVLVFVVVCEVCRSLGEDGLSASIAELAGAFAALLYAANVRMVISDRTVRMYPLVMVAELLQITFFVRAQRRGAFLDHGGIAIFTAAMLAANFTSSFLLISEVLWLECLLLVKEAGSRAGGLKILGPLAALIAGATLLLPWLPAGLASSEHAVQAGFINWIALRPISWPYETLRSGAGSHVLFWILVALGGFGTWRQWYSARMVAAFLLVWTTGPILVAMTITYLIHSVESERYVIISFVGLLALGALGAASVRSTALRVVLAVLFIHFMIRPVHRWMRRSHDAAWREAAMLAVEKSAPGEIISVVPSYAVNVVRYYLPRDRRDAAVGIDFGCGSGRVLILSGRGWMPADQISRVAACYPHLLQRLPMAEVRAR